jgi:hypothetical protein
MTIKKICTTNKRIEFEKLVHITNLDEKDRLRTILAK